MVEGGDYENPQPYEGKPFTSDDINDFFGYVYCITNRQQVRSTSAENISYRNVNPEVVNEKLLANRIGREILWIVPRTQVRRIRIWKGNFSREILSLHTTLGKTNYEETRQLFVNNVLTDI